MLKCLTRPQENPKRLPMTMLFYLAVGLTIF